MLVTLLVLAPAGLILAVLSLPASRRRRVSAAGGPLVPPARREPAGGTAVPDPGRETAAERQPYDGSGVLIGEVQEP